MGDEPLVLEGVSKSFNGRTAVRDLSFAVPRGAILGFLGPNGAGKSTSLRIALGVLAPDAGEARLFGGPPRIEALRRVGFLPEERGLYRRMTAQGTIAYFAQLKGMDARTANDRARALLDAHGLGDSARKTISKLSKGMAQKVQILAAMIHEPELIILDEPFSGLDPVNQQGLEKLITDVHARGATIVFSTHVMEHAERLCDQLVVIAKGQKRFGGTVAQALALAPRRAAVTTAGAFDLGAALAQRGFATTEETGQSPEAVRRWRINLPAGRDAQDALRAAIEAGAPVTAFAPEGVRLRDVFVSLASDAPEAGKAPAKKSEAA
jgi:ABC-2 type transport system ATP-binding protein